MQASNIFDIVVVTLLIVVGAIQARKGFFLQLGSITGHIAGLLFSLIIAPLAIKFIEGKLTVRINPLFLAWLVFLSLYVLFFLIIKWLGHSCSNMAKGTKVEKIDKLLGFILGLVLTFIVLVVLLYLMSKSSDDQNIINAPSWYGNSVSYQYVFKPCVEVFGNLINAVNGGSK